MKVCVLLVCICCLSWRTEAQSQLYLITAPLSLCLDAVETVFLQFFGYTSEVSVYVFLKTSMAPDHKVLFQDVVRLNSLNSFQGIAKVRLFPDKVGSDVDQVVLHVQTNQINQHLLIPISRNNGFLFIQTDKPLYTPYQKVKVRAFSMNQELRAANRSVFLTFKDPDQTTVDIVEMIDVNNGIPSMQNPFKIPIKPKLGIWTIEASYTDDFTTKAKTDFEVKEYVLPSFSILMEPQTNYISYQQFHRFNFKISATYLHGAPVAEGEVYLRYGYVSGTASPVIIPSSVTRERLTQTGEVDVTLNMQDVLNKHDGPRDLNGLVGSYLYVAVLVKEDTGGITQEAEFAFVKFVKSPFHLSLVSTPPFIKPGLPYNIKMLVRDHLDQPVNRVPVRLMDKQLIMDGGNSVDMSCQDSGTSGPDGLVYFICNPLKNSVRAVLKFETVDSTLPSASQAGLTLEPVAYHSPNQRYLYIDTPMFGRSLSVGKYANIHVYSATPSYLRIKYLNYLVLSKGKVVDFKSVDFVSSADDKQTLNFLVTTSMVPSIRLLVYYVLFGEGTTELVADSVWMDVKDNCVNGLQVGVSVRQQQQTFRPKENINLNVRTNQDGLVALSAVDSAIFTLRPNYRDPVTMVLRHIEHSDRGCGGGGGKDNADIFRLAGLTFMTNANANPSSNSEPCTAAVRSKRALTSEEKATKAKSYGRFKMCCEEGMKRSPTIWSCQEFAEKRILNSREKCVQVFKECCEYMQKGIEREHPVLGRFELGVDFDLAPSLIRSYFPESWLWEVQRTRSHQLLVTKSLPDSLTTWQIKAVGMFQNGMCVADPVKVSVSLPLSVDVPLPYQVVQGEQLELQGSVYNQDINSIKYCVTLTAGPELCMLQSQLATEGAGLHSTVSKCSQLPAGGVGQVKFTVMGLEPGEHTLTFTLKTKTGPVDVVKKTLRVVPEGVRQEVTSGGTLDPQGLYGSEKRSVVLMNSLPENMVPNSVVERLLTINGELPVEIVSVILKPETIKELVNLTPGSAMMELDRLLPLIQVFRYMETTSSWNILGENIEKNAGDLRQRINQGLVALSSFRKGDSSYSAWIKGDPSTIITAEVVRALALVDPFVSVSHQLLSDSMRHQLLSDSVNWLIHRTQQADGSFSENSSFKLNKIMVEGGDKVERSVFVTSIVLMALCQASSIRDPVLQLQSHDISMKSAANYISQYALKVRSVYVQAVATYALTLHDPNSMAVSQLIGSLERLARQKGNPVSLRYWQESSVTADWLKPDQSSGLTVETTAYVLLAMLLKGRIHYANPILTWLSQDQHYGEGFYSIKDTVLTLEALTEYRKVTPRAVLSQDINIRYKRKGMLGQVQLSQSRPVATPIQVTKDDDITVSTGYGRGVSIVKLKTVYYQTTASVKSRCNFDLTIEVVGPNGRLRSDNTSIQAPYLVTCIKYKPPLNEMYTESTLTVMKIQLPTGVEPQMEDLREFRDGEDPVVSHYELEGSTVVIQMDSVPSDIFLCISFRVRTRFEVIGATESLLSVTEPQDRGSLCIKQYSAQQLRLQRLCVDEQCQCMTAACASYRGNMDNTLTAEKRKEETCKPHIKYAYKLTVKSSAAEGDFLTYRATVDEVLKNSQEFEAVSSGTEVDLVKKVTCSRVDLQNNKQYLVLGSRGSEVKHNNLLKYRVPLDSETLVELLQTECSSPECQDYTSQMSKFVLDLQLEGCT